jgi:hypothetical protein
MLTHDLVVGTPHTPDILHTRHPTPAPPTPWTLHAAAATVALRWVAVSEVWGLRMSTHDLVVGAPHTPDILHPGHSTPRPLRATASHPDNALGCVVCFQGVELYAAAATVSLRCVALSEVWGLRMSTHDLVVGAPHTPATLRNGSPLPRHCAPRTLRATTPPPAPPLPWVALAEIGALNSELCGVGGVIKCGDGGARARIIIS